ncbi:MAG: ectonucleotide pyrophosphatase/phosphodiesterase family protein 5 [Colwellia sp.]|jgi:ectonucleotide pyrophosphatase/phosphodiesterase family protein 5|uniref:alkaline phosphatase family protein n=1 Tax=unclassified Colwellia TaxID=196834 RepID=UPI0015F5D681|nr:MULTISPECIES: ectonucleotide pyrophosphatase/phosphodiesterase [unclassified Colwellia]MBA6254231.1 alkaline phosphatase family protein [Colwellia sp. MB3u-55]MBA6397510.1 alkaline phosphatase family protein [Colwellia sp. BRX10-4]
MNKLFIIGMLFALNACTSESKNSLGMASNPNPKPYVLLISLDGFRWDYVDKYQPTFLSQFAKESAHLTSLRPTFPTKTFPNHLSIVTGSYPENHGIVSNRFYARDLNKTYSIRDSEAVTNPDFYLRKPLWIIAEEQNMRTANYFWPSSEAAIAGIYPSHFKKYDHNASHQERIDGVLNWYQLPSSERPQLITTYFHDIDSAGHGFGQDSPELIAAINRVDSTIREMVEKVRALDFEVNIIIVSDHGMADYPAKNYEYLPNWLNEEYKVLATNPITLIYDEGKSTRTLAQTVARLNQQAKHYKCYQYQDIPAKFNASKSSRIGDIACLTDNDWSIGFTGKTSKGNHGWSQFDTTDMDGIFYAQGPAFKKAYQLDTAENINIMPLIADILGLEITTPIDGKLAIMKPLLK